MARTHLCLAALAFLLAVSSTLAQRGKIASAYTILWYFKITLKRQAHFREQEFYNYILHLHMTLILDFTEFMNIY